MNSTMLHGISPDELTEKILNGVKEQMEQFKKDIVPTEKNDYLTRKQVSELLQISLFCVHDWMKKGILHPLKMGNLTYFDRKEIEKKLFNSNIL